MFLSSFLLTSMSEKFPLKSATLHFYGKYVHWYPLTVCSAGIYIYIHILTKLLCQITCKFGLDLWITR